MDLRDAVKVAEDYVAKLGCGNGPRLMVFTQETMECDFGWVFFYGPSDPSILVAGNAPFIVDRKDGSVHVTGTAYPVELYLESYARVGRAYPFAIPEHIVILEGWKPGNPCFQKVSLTKLMRATAGTGLADAKHCTDEVLAGRSVALTFPTAALVDAFCADAKGLGALAKREAHFR